MAYQRGSLKKLPRKGGETWVLRYRVIGPDGRRIENTTPVGLVLDFPKKKDAWREVDKLGVLVRINESARPVCIRFNSLAEQYLKNDFGADAVRPKTERTTLNTRQIVRAYLVPRWGKEIADEIKPIEIQRWLKSLNTDKGLAWTTVSKFRGTMLRIKSGCSTSWLPRIPCWRSRHDPPPTTGRF
jgi:integrase